MNVTLDRVAMQRGGNTLVFERFLNHPIKEVWASITDPTRLAQWFATATADPSKAKDFELEFGNTGIIVQCKTLKVKAPNRLEFMWGAQTEPKKAPAPEARLNAEEGGGTCHQPLAKSKVIFELAAHDGGTVLKLSHALPTIKAGARAAKIDKSSVLAGWQNHIEALTEGIGRSFKGARRESWQWSRWTELRQRFSDALD